MMETYPLQATIATEDRFLAGYAAGRNGAALRDESSHGRIWLAGEDRIAFMQRLSTNEMRLSPGQGTVTILTSPTARIIAVLTVQIHRDGLLLITGAVGFVGLVTPHLVRRAGGRDHRVLLPASVLLGGSLLVFADTLARTLVSPMQLPVGVLTALIGVPVFLFLLRRRSVA